MARWKTKDTTRRVFDADAAKEIQTAIRSLAKTVTDHFVITDTPTEKLLRMVVHHNDYEILYKARRLVSSSVWAQAKDPAVRVEHHTEVVNRAQLRFIHSSDDPAAILLPAYATGYQHTLSHKADPEFVAGLKQKLEDWLTQCHDWGLVLALFNYMNEAPHIFTKRSMRYLWPAIAPLLRRAAPHDEQCRIWAVNLGAASASWHTAVPENIKKALVYTNEVVARGVLYNSEYSVPLRANGTVGITATYPEPGVEHVAWPGCPVMPLVD